MDDIRHGINYSCKCHIDDTDLCKDCSKLLDDHDEHCDLCSSDVHERLEWKVSGGCQRIPS